MNSIKKLTKIKVKKDFPGYKIGDVLTRWTIGNEGFIHNGDYDRYFSLEEVLTNTNFFELIFEEVGVEKQKK